MARCASSRGCSKRRRGAATAACRSCSAVSRAPSARAAAALSPTRSPAVRRHGPPARCPTRSGRCSVSRRIRDAGASPCAARGSRSGSMRSRSERCESAPPKRTCGSGARATANSRSTRMCGAANWRWFAMNSRTAIADRSDSQTVVVTGASAGLGRSLACAFAKRRARVALLARGADGLDGARREVERLGGTALAIALDVADADAVERAVDEIEAALGPIDIWVNNAMVSVFSPIAETTAGEFRRVAEVTYLGTVYGTLSALRRMRPRDRGTIVQIGSALAFRGIPLQAAYCAAKHAVQGFTESLRCELAHDRSGVRVAMVEMPALNTPQFDWVRTRLPGRPQPVPPIFQPEVGARAVLFAIDTGRTEVYVGWPSVAAIVGNKWFPRLGDWYLARTGYDAQQMDEPVAPGRADNQIGRAAWR